MKKILVLFCLSLVFFSSCRSKKVLIEQEITQIDTNILLKGDTVSSKGKIGKDTMVTDSTTGIKTIIKFQGEEYKITTITPDKIVPIKETRTKNKYVIPSIEKAKSRHERKSTRDSLESKIKINKDSLKYDQKKNKDSLNADIKKTRIEKKVSFFEKLKSIIAWAFIGGILTIIIVFGKKLLKK